MMKIKRLYVCAFVLSLFSGSVFSAPITFNVDIDTSSISGQLARLVLSGENGVGSPGEASVLVSNVTGIIPLDSPRFEGGGITGDLGDEVLFEADQIFPSSNFLQDVILSNILTLDVTFDGGSLDTPNNNDATFFVSFGIRDLGTGDALLPASPARTNWTLELGPSGTITPLSVAAGTTINQQGNAAAGTVPAPGILALMLIGLFGMKRYLPKPQVPVPAAA